MGPPHLQGKHEDFCHGEAGNSTEGGDVLKKHSQFFVSLFFTSELLILSAAWVGSYYLRFHIQIIDEPPSTVPLLTYLLYLVSVILSWAIIARIMKLYRPRRVGSGTRELTEVAKAVTATLVIVVCVTYATRRFEFSRQAYVIFWIISIAGLSTERLLLRTALRAYRKKGYNLRSALLVGSGRLMERLIDAVSDHVELGVVLNGIVTFKPKEVGKSVGGIPVIGTVDDLERIMEEFPCQLVFVALPLEGHQHMAHVLDVLVGRMLDIKIVPDVYEYIALRGELDAIDEIPLVGLQTSPLAGWNRVIKRGFDLVVASVATVVFLPLGMLIAIAIKVTSPGTVFYMQERMGLDGRSFKMYKFRSMGPDAEKDSGPVWASEGDARSTPVGRFLRRLNLDELPQLINVIRGDMSLVGPRPERPVFVSKFKREFPEYMLRHRIKAGMTGWAQVNGFRGNSPLEKRVEYDLWYIKNWSVWFDLKIIFMTLWRGFTNAY